MSLKPLFLQKKTNKYTTAMKVISIGRESGCDIVLNDTTDVISRRHAILNIYPTGKMTISDQGYNGTYVNGIRITPNVPFPVTRNDVVSFAHVMQLDWKLVPNQRSRLIYSSIIIIVIVFALMAVGIYFMNNGKVFKNNKVVSDTTRVDTMKKNSSNITKKESIKKNDTPAKTSQKTSTHQNKFRKTEKKSDKDTKDVDKTKPAKQEDKPTKDNSKERIM